MRRAPRADDADGVMISMLEFAPDVKHDRRRMNLAHWLRIGWRLLRNDGRTEFANAFQLRRKIDNRFPARNLISDVVTDSFNLAKLIAFGRKNLLRLVKNLQQFAQSHRPDGR